MRRLVFILAIVMSSCASNDKVPADILQPEKMKGVLWDITRAQYLAYQNIRVDTALKANPQTKALTEKMLKIHQVTAEQFDKSYQWYTAHPAVLKVLLDSLYLQRQRAINEPDTLNNLPQKKKKILLDEKPILDE